MTIGVTSSCKGCFAIEHRLKTTYSATAELFHYLVAAYLRPHKKSNCTKITKTKEAINETMTGKQESRLIDDKCTSLALLSRQPLTSMIGDSPHNETGISGVDVFSNIEGRNENCETECVCILQILDEVLDILGDDPGSCFLSNKNDQSSGQRRQLKHKEPLE